MNRSAVIPKGVAPGGHLLQRQHAIQRAKAGQNDRADYAQHHKVEHKGQCQPGYGAPDLGGTFGGGHEAGKRVIRRGKG